MSAAPSPSIDSTQLATFLAVAESGGVLPASRRLNITQPAVTARIQQLEETLAAPLTLAASTTPASHILPELFARYRAAASSGAAEGAGAANPLAGLTLRVSNTGQALAWVRTGVAPLALVEGQPKAAGIHLEVFMRDELLPAYAPGALPKGILARLQKLRRPAEFAGLGIPVLWREEGSGTRRVVENALDRLGMPAGVWSEGIQVGGGTDAMKAAALAGLGIAFLSGCAIRNELASGALRVLPVRALRIPRAFLWALPGAGLSGAAAAFKRFADQEIRAGYLRPDGPGGILKQVKQGEQGEEREQRDANLHDFPMSNSQ